MYLLGTLCVIALASVALAVEDVVVVDVGRMEMYSSMCSSEQHGTLKADPFDCQQFIQCDYGKAAVKKCSQGLRYDSRLSVCNWEHLVQCGSTNPGVVGVIFTYNRIFNKYLATLSDPTQSRWSSSLFRL